MSFKEYNKEILNAIECIDTILLEEDFSAYRQIRESLVKALNFLLDDMKENAVNHLLLCIRLLMDAPPKNKDLGLETLVKIDSIYKQLS